MTEFCTRRRGRPSTYSLERCDAIIEIMRAGYTMTAAAGLMGVSRVTLYRWVAIYPEFSYALSLAKALYAFKWESELLAATDATRVKLCIAALKSTEEFRPRVPGQRPLEPEFPSPT